MLLHLAQMYYRESHAAEVFVSSSIVAQGSSTVEWQKMGIHERAVELGKDSISKPR